MNFHAERDAATLAAKAQRMDGAAVAAAGAVVMPQTSGEKRKLNLRPLASLVPYVKRYRGRPLSPPSNAPR